jgi:hypothetical protein
MYIQGVGPVTLIETPSDECLVALYRVYSDEVFAAGWIGSPESSPEQYRHFVDWLRRALTNPSAEWELAEYEEHDLPAIRRAWAEATTRA